MFQIHFGDYDATTAKYCYIRLNDPNPIKQLHIVTLFMRFIPRNNKLVGITITKHRLEAYPELDKAIHETLLPLLEKAHKSNVENIINTFMIFYYEELE